MPALRKIIMWYPPLCADLQVKVQTYNDEALVNGHQEKLKAGISSVREDTNKEKLTEKAKQTRN